MLRPLRKQQRQRTSAAPWKHSRRRMVRCGEPVISSPWCRHTWMICRMMVLAEVENSTCCMLSTVTGDTKWKLATHLAFFMCVSLISGIFIVKVFVARLGSVETFSNLFDHLGRMHTTILAKSIKSWERQSHRTGGCKKHDMSTNVSCSLVERGANAKRLGAMCPALKKQLKKHN